MNPSTNNAQRDAQAAETDLAPEVRYQLLRAYLNPELDNFQVCEFFGITPTQFLAWVNDPETQKRLDDQTSLAHARALHAARMALPGAIATLEHIIQTCNHAERNEPLANTPIARNIRQRQRESARRAAGLICRIGGILSAAPRPARALKPDDQPRAAAAESHARPTTIGTPEPAFLKTFRAALARRADELQALQASVASPAPESSMPSSAPAAPGPFTEPPDSTTSPTSPSPASATAPTSQPEPPARKPAQSRTIALRFVTPRARHFSSAAVAHKPPERDTS